MSQELDTAIAVIGIDIGKNSFHVVGHDKRGAIVLRQKWSRGQVETRLANLPPCLIGMEACVGAHHLSRKLQRARRTADAGEVRAALPNRSVSEWGEALFSPLDQIARRGDTSEPITKAQAVPGLPAGDKASRQARLARAKGAPDQAIVKAAISAKTMS